METSDMSVEASVNDQDDTGNISPDIFADFSPPDIGSSLDSIAKDGNMCDNTAPEKSGSGRRETWLGAAMDEIRNGSRPCLPPIVPSHSHTVFFQLPVSYGQPPKPHPQNTRDRWDSDHVRMPFSEHNLYPVQEEGEQSKLRQRWELVQEALLKKILSSHQLEAVILSYNSKYSELWDFSILHQLFNEVFSEEETTNFFTTLLPKIIRLALQLPTLLTAPVPLLVQHSNHALSFTQLQIASLLANAFLCTFPRRNTSKRQSEYARYPDINFNRLFQMHGRFTSKIEKLKCLLHYFRRVCTRAPDGVVTYMRRYLSRENLPQWERSQKLLTKLYITSEGTIEDDGGGLLQVDFANRLIGGGVLGNGCVQEEIRFVICPELIVARLFTEALDSTEALLIVGCERFSNYRGYSDTFQWMGDHQDGTPVDSSRRRLCSVVAIDALRLGNRNVQYMPNNLLRELNKAYVGFHSPEFEPGERLAGVASGNWGCGAYRGDAKLKTLLQLMAASQAGRHLAYFTFGDANLRDQVYHLYTYLTAQEVTVGQLWHLLCQYYEYSYRGGRLVTELYPFLYQALSKKSNSAATTCGEAVKLPQKCVYQRSTVQDRPRGGGQGKWLSSRNRGGLTEKELELALVSLPVDKDSVCVSDPASCSAVGENVKPLNQSYSSKNPEQKEKQDKRRGSLFQYLEECDNRSVGTLPTSSPTPKRKISDYFNPVSRSK